MASYFPLSLPRSDGTGKHELIVQIVHHRNARRLVMRVRDPKRLRITLPSGASATEALAFAQSQHEWIARQIARRQQTANATVWQVGTHVLFHGEPSPLTYDHDATRGWIHFADQRISVRHLPTDFRPAVERHLRRIAEDEIPPLARDFAASINIEIGKVTIRDQRTRWGSCSSNKDISLNWRLVQLPPFVRDYIILHELTHCLELSHSKRFWQLLRKLCPHTDTARQWLRSYPLGTA